MHAQTPSSSSVMSHGDRWEPDPLTIRRLLSLKLIKNNLLAVMQQDKNSCEERKQKEEKKRMWLEGLGHKGTQSQFRSHMLFFIT
jgi:hypothetical protein